MSITNDPTGFRSTCTACGEAIEEARLFKGMRLALWDDETKPPNQRKRIGSQVSPGMLVWRTLDRGHGSAQCETGAEGRHQPGKTRRVSAR